MLNIIDRHVLRQVSLPLVVALVIGLLMLLADRMVSLLDTTLGKKNSFAVVFEMLAYLVPHYLGTAIPAALFLGLLLGFGKMSANSETDAFMASGISLNRLARPVILLGLAMSVLSLAIGGWLQPYARYAFRSVIFEVRNIDVFYLAEEGVFMQAGDRTFIIDKLDRSTNAFERAFIFRDKGYEGSETVTAARGSLVETTEDNRPVLHLERGHRLTLGHPPAPGASTASEMTDFAFADTPLGRIGKDIFRPRGDDEREMTIPELYANLDTPPKGATAEQMTAELSGRLVVAASILILPFLAIPFAVGPRRNPRALRTVTALALIVIYHEIIQQGVNIAGKGTLSHWLALWLPFCLLSIFAFWRYAAACFTVSGDTFGSALDRLGDLSTGLRGRLMRRLGWGQAA